MTEVCKVTAEDIPALHDLRKYFPSDKEDIGTSTVNLKHLTVENSIWDPTLPFEGDPK